MSPKTPKLKLFRIIIDELRSVRASFYLAPRCLIKGDGNSKKTFLFSFQKLTINTLYQAWIIIELTKNFYGSTKTI